MEKFNNIAKKYPDQVTLGVPIQKQELIELENKLDFKLDSHLRDIYLFSNGMSFLDYGLAGLGDQKSGDLEDLNSYSDLVLNSKRVIIFMATSGYHEFGYVENKNGGPSKVVMIEPVEYEMELIANSVEEFFEKFTSKMEKMLEIISPDEDVMYFDDDELPEELNIW